MRDKRFIIVLVCAVLFGLAAAGLVGRYLTNVEGRSNQIVVAKIDIPLSTRITADQLAIQQLPRDATPTGTFTAIDKLVGRVTTTSIGAREPLTEMKLAPEGTEPGLTAVIAEGFRAITVKVDDVVGVAGFVEPGAWVDVVAVVNPVDHASDHGPTSKIVLQHIKVLATDKNIGNEKKDSAVISVKAVTLQALPAQAEKLALAAAEGKLQLVMRNSVDKDDVSTPGVNKNSLLAGDRVAPDPAPEAPRLPPAASRGATPRPRGSRPQARPQVFSPPAPTLLSLEPNRAPGEKPAPPKPAPARLSVDVFDGGKRHKVELP